VSLFSIVIANYNNEKYIAEAIESVINQSFSEWELIIVDDASTDSSIEIINKYLKRYKNIKLIQNTCRKGIGASRNIGVKNITTKLFGDLDADDTLSLDAIEIMYEEHEKNPDYSMIYSQFQKCDNDMNIIGKGYCNHIPIGKTNLEANVVSHFRTYKLDYFNQTSGFHEDIPKAIDKDISFKMEEVGKLKFIDKNLYFYRQNIKGISQYNNVKSAKNCFEEVKKQTKARREMKLSILLATDKSFTRQHYLDWAKERYENMFPYADVVIGVDDANRDDFCKSRAINNAAKAASGDIFFIVDTDIYVTKQQILRGIEKLNYYSLVTTHGIYHRLRKEFSEKFLREEVKIEEVTKKDIESSFDFNDNTGRFKYLNGGVQILTKDNFYKCNGYDESFIGWGGEDTAFNANVVLKCGNFHKMPGEAYHLWHPRQTGYFSYKISEENFNYFYAHAYIMSAEKKDDKILKDFLKDLKVHYYADEKHYEDHSFLIWDNLPIKYKGKRYDEISEIPSTGYLLVAGKVNEFTRNNLILINHGAGQSYSPYNNCSYAGGEGRDNVKLFLHPNDYATELDKNKYINSSQVVVGCPKLDSWHQKVLLGEIKQREEIPVIAISFHFDCYVCPETRSSWEYYKSVLPMLAYKNLTKEWKILGHGHPRAIKELSFYYQENGIEIVEDFNEVMERADLYIMDHMSTLYEFASTNRPVIVLNAPWYRREIEHGLRYWEYADVGINVNHPSELEKAIHLALEDPLEQKMKRERAVAAVYKYRDGMATERAAKAIVDFIESGSQKENQIMTQTKQIQGRTLEERFFGSPRRRR
jgi:glycosyltransferase involved in cell wall biosynthesis